MCALSRTRLGFDSLNWAKVAITSGSIRLKQDISDPAKKVPSYLKKMTEMDIEQFKQWLRDCDTTKPISQVA